MLELICGACQGRLLVETPGTTVACPHCGTVLETAVEPPPGAPGTIVQTADSDPATAPDPAADTVRMDFWVPSPSAPDSLGLTEIFPGPAGAAGSAEAIPDFTFLQPAPDIPAALAGNEIPPEPAPSVDAPLEPVAIAEAAEPISEPAGVPEFAPAIGTAESLSANEPAAGDAVPVEAIPMALGAEPAVGEMPRPDVAAASAAESPQRAAALSATPAARTGPSPFAFKLVVSYASAMTLACLYLLWLVYFLRTHSRTLDLPDLAPDASHKKVGLMYVRPNQDMPAANVMRLGQTRQYGSLNVTPLRVTRGPVEFMYYDADKGYERPPEGPVLKLHLRFANVSPDQEFAPLDGRLVFTKIPDRKAFGLFWTNNFVCSAAERKDRARHVLAFDLSPDSPWMLKGQNLDRELKPGESVETFIATSQENLDSLEGDLLWRVHFRKGYNRESFRGVTTLIEVRFKSSDIVDEPPLPAEDAKAEGSDA